MNSEIGPGVLGLEPPLNDTQAPPPYMRQDDERPGEGSEVASAAQLPPLTVPQPVMPEKAALEHHLRVLSASSQTTSDPGPSSSKPAAIPSELARQNGVRIRRRGDVRETFVIDPSLHAPQGGGEQALDIQTTSDKGVVDARVYLVDSKMNEAPADQAVEMSIKASSVRLTIAHATRNHRLKMHIQTHKRPAGVRKDMLEVYLCPDARVDLDVNWAAPCLINLPPNFTGKVDLHVAKRDTVTIEHALKPRTRVLNEERGVQLLWIGEYTPGTEESEFDHCFVRTQGGITLGVWEEDPEFRMENGAIWMPEGTGGEVMEKFKSVAGRSLPNGLMRGLMGRQKS